MSPPLTPDADQARRLLENELAKPEYRDPGNWIRDQLQRLLDWLTSGPDNVTTMSDGQLAALIIGAVILAGALIWLVMGPLRADRRRKPGAVLDDEERSAADLLQDARLLAGSDDWSQATLQAYRAMVRSLAERAIIDESPGMTAHEAATRAAPRLPSLASALANGADVFDALAYGHRPGSRSQYETMLALHDQVAATSPTLPAMTEPEAPVTVEAAQ